jgi:hypothetical protein
MRRRAAAALASSDAQRRHCGMRDLDAERSPRNQLLYNRREFALRRRDAVA